MQVIQISIPPQKAQDDKFIRELISNETRSSKFDYRIIKRSIDARQKPVLYNLKIEVYDEGAKIPKRLSKKKYNNVSDKEEIIIIGCGPAGMFAALKLIELGFKPIILERGKAVRERRRDLAAINKEHLVNPDSNYCFGEGGAGTYSDGKLYTRSKKRGDVQEILEIFVHHGAEEDVLIDAQPHIGTNKLPAVITEMRETIIKAGGLVLFENKIEDLIIKNGQIEGVVNQHGEKFLAKNVILCTGHSARDIFELLKQKQIKIEAKPFAIGLRIEHPQGLIDSIQYKLKNRGDILPPSSYRMATQVKQRGVFSFCMCPGGIIAPSATSPGEIVTNGWSPSKRNNPFANSGIVVSIEKEDFEKFKEFGELAGMEYQKNIEQACYVAAGNDPKSPKGQLAPAQRLMDFLANKISSDLPKCSYTPGVVSAPLHEILPHGIVSRLQEGLKTFGQKKRGYLSNEAILVGVESRTSSPVKIPRDKESLEHPEVKGLYPCGEGAGFAGGIVSAAIDGQKCAIAAVS